MNFAYYEIGIHIITAITFIYTLLTYKKIYFPNNPFLDSQFEETKISFMIGVVSYTVFSILLLYFDYTWLKDLRMIITVICMVLIITRGLSVPILLSSIFYVTLIAHYYFDFTLQ